MNKSQTTSTLERRDFSLVEGPGVESGGWNVCPTIDPASLVGPGRGAIYIYDAGLVWPEVAPVGDAWAPRSSASPVERFQKLVTAWKSGVRFVSDVDEICGHPAYQEIIGMGAAALPFIFCELEHCPDNWFWALKAITGEDPVPEEHRGNMTLMAQDWLRWWQSYKGSVLYELRGVLVALDC